MSADQTPYMQISNQSGSIPGLAAGMQGTFSNPNSSLPQRNAAHQQRMLELMDEKQILQHEIDQQKEKIA